MMNFQSIFAFILSLIVTPILLFAFLLILIFDQQSPLFLQERIGLNKIPFTIIKLQTMKNGKATFIGKVLRKTGVDELVQMINILKGEMSFVGPRPLTQYDINRLEWNTEEFSLRWSVRPGITGMAQLVNVCDKNVSWKNDQEYIRNKSIILDIKIIFRSILVPFLGKKVGKQILNKSK